MYASDSACICLDNANSTTSVSVCVCVCTCSHVCVCVEEREMREFYQRNMTDTGDDDFSFFTSLEISANFSSSHSSMEAWA